MITKKNIDTELKRNPGNYKQKLFFLNDLLLLSYDDAKDDVVKRREIKDLLVYIQLHLIERHQKEVNEFVDGMIKIVGVPYH